jgi:hypothetical protein
MMSVADDLLRDLIWARIALTSIETFAEHLGATFRESAAMLDRVSSEDKAELLSVFLDSAAQNMEAIAATARGESGQVDAEAIFKQARDKFEEAG